MSEKGQRDFERLCLKDGRLSFKAMEFGSLRYIGQVRLMQVFDGSDNASGAGRFRQQQGRDSN